MAVDHDTHAEPRQAGVVAQLRITVGDQHQRDVQVLGYRLEVGEVAHADQADTIGAGFLVGQGALDHRIDVDQFGVGPGNDGQRRVDPRLRAARILPTPSSTQIRSVDLRPNCAGSRVSSMVSAAIPARSSSTTVRITFSALP